MPRVVDDQSVSFHILHDVAHRRVGMPYLVGNGRDGLCLAVCQHEENRKPFRLEIVPVQAVYVGGIRRDAVCQQPQPAADSHLSCLVKEVHNLYVLYKT